MPHSSDDSAASPFPAMRLRRGDPEVMAAEFAAERPRLRRLAARATARHGAGLVSASDLVQSALLKAVVSLGSFRGTGRKQFARWMRRILWNTIHDRVGSRIRQQRLFRRQGDGTEVPTNSPSPVRAAAAQENLDAAVEAMMSLSDRHRRVIEICILDGRTHAEAAEILECSEGASRVLLARARTALAMEVERRQRRGHDA